MTLKRCVAVGLVLLLTASSVSAGVLFESFWDTALGTSDVAWRHGGRWTWATSWDNPPTPVMQVVTGGPGGHNALLTPLSLFLGRLQSHDLVRRQEWSFDLFNAGIHVGHDWGQPRP